MASQGIIRKLEKLEYGLHENKKSGLQKFLVVIGIFLIYLIAMVLEYGLENGIMVGLLSWSFFVFCTPIADAGFLLDFPLRLLAKIRMIYSEMGIWVIATLLNVYALTFTPGIYEKRAF